MNLGKNIENSNEKVFEYLNKPIIGFGKMASKKDSDNFHG